MVFWINGFPLPPSVNNYLMPVAGKVKFTKRGKPYRAGRLVKTPMHKRYYNRCMIWAAMNQKAVMAMRNELIKYKEEIEGKGLKFALRVDHYFAFHVDQMWSEKSPDADNRLKPCRDALKKILELDDVYFFAGICEKVTTDSKDSECTMIRIAPMQHRNLDEIKALMIRETNTRGI